MSNTNWLVMDLVMCYELQLRVTVRFMLKNSDLCLYITHTTLNMFKLGAKLILVASSWHIPFQSCGNFYQQQIQYKVNH